MTRHFQPCRPDPRPVLVVIGGGRSKETGDLSGGEYPPPTKNIPYILVYFLSYYFKIFCLENLQASVKIINWLHFFRLLYLQIKISKANLIFVLKMENDYFLAALIVI